MSLIVFASQRGGGSDLARHLLNALDNEYVEVHDIRGSMADDVHGAFGEWGAQAAAMTKCKNYLYSLSINPDPAQGPMPRELYAEYIERAELALGLEGQGRAVVFHIKDDKAGNPREHCHVVWSRIDVQECKAIHMAFDHDKLMTVTRQFARDHGRELPAGYYKLEERKRQTHRQLSLYDKFQEDTSGLTREERTALVTELWQRRDSPEAFIQALEYHGYILTHGKRPYVLVDIYGHTNSLPKLIDDKSANTKAIRDFLGDTYGPKNLPSVEEARQFAARHREALKDYRSTEARADQIDLLKEHQSRRREKLEADIAQRLERQKLDRRHQDAQHKDERSSQRGAYLQQAKAIRLERYQNRPQGLAGFLARVSGVELAQRKIHKYQDKKRYEAFLSEKHEMRERQAAQQQELQRCQEMQALDLERKRRALDQTENREMRTLEMTFEKQRRMTARAGHEHMPSMQLTLTPRGRPAAPHKAMNRYTSELAREMQQAKQRTVPSPAAKPETLSDHFDRAAGAEPRSEDTARGDSDGSPAQPTGTDTPAQDFQRKSRDDDGGRTR